MRETVAAWQWRCHSAMNKCNDFSVLYCGSGRQWQLAATLQVTDIKKKKRGVADAWQPSTNVHPRGTEATTGLPYEYGFRLTKKFEREVGRKTTPPGRTAGRTEGRG